MCARFTIGEKEFKPSMPVPARRFSGYPPSNAVWISFAQEEKLKGWLSKPHSLLVEIPADRFAEKTDDTGQLLWAKMPANTFICALLEAEVRGYQPLRIVTRAANPEEKEFFNHVRVPWVGNLAGDRDFKPTTEKFLFEKVIRERQGDLFL